jgi:hypothetical protein
MLLLVVAGVASSCPVEEARLRYGVDIVVEGQTWDQPSLDAVLGALERLPPHVVGNLGNPDYGPLRILSNSQAATLSGDRPYSLPANFYYNNEERNEIVLVPFQDTLTILHEMGHAYQMRGVPAARYGWAYLDPEMRDFMDTTGWRLLDSEEEVRNSWDGTELRFKYDGEPVWQGLSREDPIEDYANSFAFFFFDPEALEHISPVRYDWFLQNVGVAP